MGANNPQDGAVFDPRGMIGRIYVGYHKILMHAKYTISSSCGFIEEDFPIISLRQTLTSPGRGQVEPQGHG